MAVRAKMRCDSVTLRKGSVARRDEEGNQVKNESGGQVYDPVDLPTVRLTAVSGDYDSETGKYVPNENTSFWDATPSGNVELSISNPDAAEFFELGESYYIDFEKAS